ncbi:MAG: DUF1641 domain-containing protein [Thermoprotei archaeon]
MSAGSGTEQPATITLTREEVEQLKAFLSTLPKLNVLVGRLGELASDGQLEALSTLLSATRSMKEALNDEAIQSLASTAGKALELVSLLSQSSSGKALAPIGEHGEQLGELIAKIAQMQKDGVFEAISQAAYALKASMDALNEEAVTNLASTLSEAAATWRSVSPILTSPELVAALNRVIKMEREGVLAAIEEVGYTFKSLRDALNDEALVNLANTVAEALHIWRTISPYVERMARSPLPKVFEALSREGLTEQLEAAKPRSGISILSPQDPDIRKGFGVLLEILKAIGSEFSKEGEVKKD